jgi:hypothetical protein
MYKILNKEIKGIGHVKKSRRNHNSPPAPSSSLRVLHFTLASITTTLNLPPPAPSFWVIHHHFSKHNHHVQFTTTNKHPHSEFFTTTLASRVESQSSRCNANAVNIFHQISVHSIIVHLMRFYRLRESLHGFFACARYIPAFVWESSVRKPCSHLKKLHNKVQHVFEKPKIVFWIALSLEPCGRYLSHKRILIFFKRSSNLKIQKKKLRGLNNAV